MKKISEDAKRLTGQPMFHILSKVNKLAAQGKKILHFELGDPEFNTPKNIIDSVKYSLDRGETHYVSSRGVPEFMEAIQFTTKRSRGFKPDLEQILVCCGGTAGIFKAISCTVNPGDEVIVPNPCFPPYISAINFRGAVPVKIDLISGKEFRMNPQDVKKAVTDKTSLIIINSPHNPTGSIINEKEMKKIYEIAESKDIYLLSDEVYARMIYSDSNTKFSSPSKYDKCKERTILVNCFSKSYAMPGFRLGTVIGPKELINRMSLLLETIYSCVPPFIQAGGVEAIKGDQRESLDMMKNFREKRDLIVDGLNSLPGVYCPKPRGAFYAFPNVKGTKLNGEQFTDIILKVGVACCPGVFFGNNCNNYVRFSYAHSTIQDISEAITRIDSVLRSI